MRVSCLKISFLPLLVKYSNLNIQSLLVLFIFLLCLFFFTLVLFSYFCFPEGMCTFPVTKEVTRPYPINSLGRGMTRLLQEQRKAFIEKYIQFFVLAIYCHDPSYKQPSCNEMKCILSHTWECGLIVSGKWNECMICKLCLLCIFQARNCN